MSADERTVSVIIASYNTRDILPYCLESVYEETREMAFEVIVADNASTDGSVRMLEDRFPKVIPIENRENRGIAAANNQAVAVARGRLHLPLLLQTRGPALPATRHSTPRANYRPWVGPSGGARQDG